MLPYLDGAMRLPMLPGFSFQVFLSGVPLAFQKIGSMTESIQTEQLPEGGRNHFVHSLRSPVTQEKTLTFEQGIPVGNAGIEIADIALSSQLFKIGNRFPFALILVCDRKVTRVSRAYLVMGLVLKSWSLSELDATRSDYVIERLEFAYETIERHVIDAPFLIGASVTGAAGHVSLNNAREKLAARQKELEEAEKALRKAAAERREKEDEKIKENQKKVAEMYAEEEKKLEAEEARREEQSEKADADQEDAQ